MAEHLLELRNVSQVYRNGDREFLALKDVSLALDEGEFLVLLGPSGCGKSTLLHIATGLQQPTSGEVLYRGESPGHHRVPNLCPLPLAHGFGERGGGIGGAGRAAQRAEPPGPEKFWTRLDWTGLKVPILENSPEG